MLLQRRTGRSGGASERGGRGWRVVGYGLRHGRHAEVDYKAMTLRHCPAGGEWKAVR